jgi:RNA polymerase sigma factor (sigma-70 family)
MAVVTDLSALPVRIVELAWSTRGAGSRPWCAKPRGDRLPRSRRSSASTGRRPSARRSSWSTMPRPPRTSRRRRFSPPSATSIASIAAGRSPRGCTASSSIGPSTTPAPEPCAPRPTSIQRSQHRQLRREAGLEETAARDRDVELSDDVITALADLTPEHRSVIVLRHLLGYTPGEIAELLGLPRGTVNSRLRRGLDTLRERLPS